MSKIYMLFDARRGTYEIGGGSSTPSKERIYYTLQRAEVMKRRYFPYAEIHVYVREEAPFTYAPMDEQNKEVQSVLDRELEREGLTGVGRAVILENTTQYSNRMIN